MFTGIIEEVGRIASVEARGNGRVLTVEATRLTGDMTVNDSVSINGACQTVVRAHGTFFEVIAVEETLRKTTLGSFIRGSPVNLELPMRLNERLGGHLVLGHVDLVGRIRMTEKRENSWMFRLAFPAEFSRYVVQVGSVAVDGVSLTIASCEQDTLDVSIIPHTWENTIFRTYREGTEVNVEFDILGKYIEKLVAARSGGREVKPSLTLKYLREHGF